MSDIWRVEMNRHSWRDLREASGSAAGIPHALEGMLTADSPNAVDVAYWKLENHVVVQGELFEAAPHVVSVLLAALLDNSPSFIRIGILELLFQILGGESHESEGERDLGPKCRDLAREGLWLLYGELGAGLPGQRAAALEVLNLVETDRGRLRAIVGSISI